jgi:hypothetical protein
MKKALCFALSIFILLTVVSCGNPKDKSDYTVTVYVSKYGKIHSSPHCSGMKSCLRMTLENAMKANYEVCKKCSDDIYDALVSYYYDVYVEDSFK